MSEMNEKAITKFLAEKVMGWELHKGVNPGGGIENYWMLPQGGVFQHSPPGIGEAREKDFDPMNDIKHAFMVRDRILELSEEDEELQDRFEIAYERYNEFDTIFDVSAERLSLSAARALATDALIREFGL